MGAKGWGAEERAQARGGRGPPGIAASAAVGALGRRGASSPHNPASPAPCPPTPQGVVYAGREDITPDNYLYDIAATTDRRTLKEASALGRARAGRRRPAGAARSVHARTDGHGTYENTRTHTHAHKMRTHNTHVLKLPPRPPPQSPPIPPFQ
jgi:hypothetical protein